MSDFNNFKKIQVFLNQDILFPFTINGKIISWNEDGVILQQDVEESFRKPIIILLNEKIGLHSWVIQFKNRPENNYTFEADIYLDNGSDFLSVVEIINNAFTDLKLIPRHKGTVDDYKLKGKEK